MAPVAGGVIFLMFALGIEFSPAEHGVTVADLAAGALMTPRQPVTSSCQVHMANQEV